MAQGNQPLKRNLAAEAFRRNCSALHDALVQPDVASGLARKLYNGAIITLETRDAVETPSLTPTQANLLLRAVESSIKTDHTKLQKFTRLLRKRSALKPIAKQLCQCYRKCLKFNFNALWGQCLNSLVPRPLPLRKKGPGIHCLRMHVISAINQHRFMWACIK